MAIATLLDGDCVNTSYMSCKEYDRNTVIYSLCYLMNTQIKSSFINEISAVFKFVPPL